MRSTLLSAACVAALLAGSALAQEAQTPTTDGAETTEGATTAQATTPAEGTEATDGTMTAEGTETADDAAAGETQIADDATAPEGATTDETQTAEGATATDGAATDTQSAEGADVQVTTTEGETETAATEEPAVEETAQTSAEEPAGAAVTTTNGETETAEAPEQMPLPSDPQEALAMASSQLDEAMNQYGGAVNTGTDAAAADGTTQTIDTESRDRITQALDQFDQALVQYGESSGDEQVQEQIMQLQAQSQQAREQLEDDPQGAMQNIDQLTQAALTLPQSEIPAEADLIIDTQLVSSDGEQVGEISNVLVTADGQVEAILVSRGGALGLGGSEVAVPWDQIQIQGDQTVVGMTRDEMEQLPDYVTD